MGNQKLGVALSQSNSSEIAQQAAAAATKRLRANQSEIPSDIKREVNNPHLQAIYRRLSLSVYGIPALGTVCALVLLPYTGLHWLDVGLLIIFHALGFLGLEIGYHRLFSHRAFQATIPVQAILAVLGAITVQGGVVHWVAQHRLHHHYSDKAEDPHSPHLYGTGVWPTIKGLWFAQIGWVLQGKIPNVAFWAKDVLRSPVISRVNQLQQLWVIVGILIPTILDGLITQSWMGALRGLFWAGFVRIFISQHTLGATNSLGHLCGNRMFEASDRSTNNLWMVLPSMGQAWHNNHHAFPSSAVAGFYWWQIDPSTWVLRALEKAGWVWDLKVPTKSMLDSKRITTNAKQITTS